MKAVQVVVVGVVLLGGSIACGQRYYGGAVSTHSSTAAEGAARGMSDVIRSQGVANKLNSEAAINMTEAQRRNIENQDLYTDTYFQMRQKNKAYRDAERRPRGTQEDWVRWAQAGKPKPLSPSDLDTVTGQISWPLLLQDDQFAEGREQLERLHTERAVAGSVGLDDYMEIDRITKQMQEDMKPIIRDYPTSIYIASKKFLQSLNYENRQSVN